MPPSSDYVFLQAQANELVSAVGNFLVEATQGQNNDEDSAESGRVLIDVQLQRFWRQYGLIRGRTNEPLAVAVLALTKSGKSTLLNALTSTECLPMNNVPETARICKILHTSLAPGANPGEAWLQEPGNEPPVRGERAIRTRLMQLNSDLRAHSSHAAEAAGEDNVLLVHASIAALREYDGAGLPPLALLDTPGPNEAGEEGLRHQVDRLLNSVDAVVYVLDYTKLKTAEEADMFRRLKQINPQLVKRLSQRLFFVVNKADTADVSEGMDADDTREYVAGLVTQQLAGEGFRLQPEQVVLVSARNALLSRLVLSGKASDDVVKRFSRLAFGMASQSRAPPSAEQLQSAARSLLVDSGVLDLEAQVLTFLYAHSAGVKLMATLDNVARLLSEMSNVAVSCRACLRTNVDSLQEQADGLSTKLQATLGTFDDVMAGTETLQSEVTDEIRAHLQSLRVRLFNHILQTLEAADVPGATSRVAAAVTSTTPRRWQALRDKFVSMFTSSTLNGVAAARSRSRDDLQGVLQELHDGLMAQIQVEVGEFWSVLEACTNARHAALVRQLNTTLATLGRQVEDAVCTGLNVVLQPVDISMPTPSATQFHSDLNQLIAKGIHASQEKHLRVGQRQYEERVLRWRHGVCQWGAYWETIQRTRTVVETYDVVTYELLPHNISAHFLELVDAAIETTSKALSSYVRTFVRSQLDAARASIKEYSDRYTSAMTASLEASQRGVEARALALSNVERHLAGLSDLSVRTADLQGRTEVLVPQLQDAVPYDEMSDDELYRNIIEEIADSALAAAPATVPADGAVPSFDSSAPADTDATPLAAAAPAAEAQYTRFDAAYDADDADYDAVPEIQQTSDVDGQLQLEQLAAIAASPVVAPPAVSAPSISSSDSEQEEEQEVEEAAHQAASTATGGGLSHGSSASSHSVAPSLVDSTFESEADTLSSESSLIDSTFESEADTLPSESAGSGDEEDDEEEGSLVGTESNMSTSSTLSETASFLPRANSVASSGSVPTSNSVIIGSNVSIGGNVTIGGASMTASAMDSPHLPLPPAMACPLFAAAPPVSPASSVSVAASRADEVVSTASAEAPLGLAAPAVAPADAPLPASRSSSPPLQPRQVPPLTADVNGVALAADDAAAALPAAPAAPEPPRVTSVSFHQDLHTIFPQLPDVELAVADGGAVVQQDPAAQYFDAAGGQFDYATGFVRAMSTSAMLAAAEEAAAEEWTLLDENGSSASEEDVDSSSPPSTP